jgi:dynamin 1-like protein
MKNIPNSLNEYATIRCDGVPELRINDFSEIMQKVTDCTIRLAGAQCNVSSSPIYLTVYKRDIQEDLTLIDLPGITRNPVGDQSADIYQQIVNLIKHYIEPNTAIVLHVIPSSVDFATSESIQLAKKYDTECKTIPTHFLTLKFFIF